MSIIFKIRDKIFDIAVRLAGSIFGLLGGGVNLSSGRIERISEVII